MADAATSLKLLQLAASRFNQDIWPAEQRLFEAAASGELAICAELAEKDRIVRADRLSWLCTNPEASAQVTHRGLSIDGAEIDGKVDLKWAKVSFPIVVFKCVFKDTIILSHGHIGYLSIQASAVTDLMAAGTHFEEHVFLCNGFRADGGVNLVGAKIDGNLNCDRGEFISKSKTPALNANGVEVKGGVLLRNGFKADGGVNLVGAKIDGDLSCTGGAFIGKDETLALAASRVEVKGSVFLDGFRADGGVGLVAAKIGGNLGCEGGKLIGALDADSAKIEGGAYFRKTFSVEGVVNFKAAYAGHSFQWADAESKDKSFLDLRYFKAGTLLNSENSWPNQDCLLLDGFVYERFDDRASRNAKIQLDWLHRQPRDKFQFLSQPYEQLATVFRNMGREEDARKVMIQKNKDHARHVRWRLEWLWYGLFGKLIGYGYRPWRAFWISVTLIVIGCLLFNSGYISRIVTPTEENAYALYMEKDGKGDHFERYPVFNPFIYSVETFVPFLKLGISQYWMPNANSGVHVNFGLAVLPTGSLLRWYLWFHIIAGWVLTTLWVGGLTGLVKT